MAAINSVTFDEAAYAQGATVTCTVDFTPDTPSVTAQVNTVTATVSDPSGNVLATSTADFTVNVPQAGDTAAVSDSGSRTWTAGAVTPDGSGGMDAVFTTTA